MELLGGATVAHAILAISVVSAAGLGLGALRVRGVSLGVAGVLFAGLAAGHLGMRVDPHALELVRELGLVIFVFSIGLQIGPGFLPSLRQQGLALNAMAAAIVLLGAAITVGLAAVAGIPREVAAGLFCGATTNTPALGAAQDVIRLTGGDPSAAGIGYAVAYPLAVTGIIATLAALRAAFRVDVRAEVAAFLEEQRRGQPRLARRNLCVENPNLDGLPVGRIPGVQALGVVVSRIQPAGGGEVRTAHTDSTLHRGDVILAVGPESALDELQLIVGQRAAVDLREAPGAVDSSRIVVTHRGVLGKSLRELALDHLYGVKVTRIERAGVEMTPRASLALQFGDVLQAVGEPQDLARAATVLGDSAQELSEARLVSIFFGIAIGVLVGSLPIPLGGLPVPVRLGLAGGPLLTAILLSNLGRMGPVVFYVSPVANAALRELGITLFLACVGLAAGERFLATVRTAQGLAWLAGGVVVTLVPLLVVGAAARMTRGTNFAVLSGAIAGSMTDPPALTFANGLAGGEAPTVAYAAVYPLTMLLRVLVAQLLVLLWLH